MTKQIVTAVIAALALAGCAAPEPRAHDPVRDQCEYEASAAVAGIRSGLEAGWQKGDLMRKCMRARGR